MKLFLRETLLNRFFLLTWALLLCHVAFSQESAALTELTVDRPGIADTPFTVPKGMYQFEFGFDYFRRPTGELYNLPTAQFRAGISSQIEVRLASKNVVDNTDVTTFLSVAPITAGIKMHVLKQRKGLPETDIMANIVVPVNPVAGQSKNTGYEFLLLFQNDFYPNSAINYNVGYIWDSFRGKSVFTGSFCYNYLPTRRVGLFIEYFGYVLDEWPGENGIDGGMTYLVVDWLQLDLSTGVSRIKEQNVFFASTGVSVRFK